MSSLIKLCVFIFTSFFFLQQELHAQNELLLKDYSDKTMTVWGEFGGHGILYSLAFEGIMIERPKYKMSVQLGFSTYPKDLFDNVLFAPLTLNHMYSWNNRNYIEFGFGLMFLNDGNLRNSFLTDFEMDTIVFRLGYRLRHPKKKFDVRFGFTPVAPGGLDYWQWDEIWPLFGVGVGRKL